MHPVVSLAAALVVALAEGQAEPDPGVAPAQTSPAEAPATPTPDASEAPAPQPHPRRLRPDPGQVPTPALGGATVPPAAPHPVEPEKAQVARAALTFLDALVAGDADGLARASAEKVSFDGEVRGGKDEVRRTFRALIDRRSASPHPELLDLEVLPSADAVARLGAPPARLLPLVAAKGSWVGIANLSRRPLVLFLARDGARWAVVAVHG